MTLSVTHSYVSSVGETTPSGGPGGTVGPTEWNANHTIAGVASPGQGGTGITSGTGVTYFSSATVIADSGTLTNNALVLGGGANGAPTSLSAGTTSQVLHGNASGAPTFGAVDLASQISGVLPTPNGGTGITSGTGVTYFSSATKIADSGTLTSNVLIVGGGANGAPTSITSGTTSQLLHGNASGNPSFGAVNLGSEVAGTLSTANLPTATNAAFGIVKPDNSSITISSGVITATASVGGSSGQVQYNAGASAFGGIANTNTDGANLTSFRLSTTASLDWQSSSTSSGVDVSLFRDGPSALALRNSITATTAQGLRVYNTSTSTGDYERAVFDWTTNPNSLTIGTQNSGTGAARPIMITAANGHINFGATSQINCSSAFNIFNVTNGYISRSDGGYVFSSDTSAGNSGGGGIYSVAPGVVGFTLGSGSPPAGWMQWGGQGRVSANVTTSSTSLANITGLAATLANGRNYSFSCEIIGTCSSSGGIQLALNTTSTSTGYTLLIDGYAIDAGNTVRGYSQQTAVGNSVIASTITNTSFHASLWGTITTSSSMVVNFQMAQQNLSATQTIAQRGSHSFFHDMP